MSTPSSFTQWWQTLPIPWLVAGQNGQADATAQGTAVDQQVSLIKQATKARMPGQAPSDALPHIGGDRQLEQGPAETSQNFVTRLQTAWDDWARAGTALELLVQLYWAGFVGAVIAQQNGVIYALSGAPTAGADPTSLLVISSAGALPTALTSPTNPGRSIPAGTPWFTIDTNIDFCSRFYVLLPLPMSGSFIYSQVALATFTASDNATVTWSTPIQFTGYQTTLGPPQVSDGLGPVAVDADGTTTTSTGVTLRASAPFTGTVWASAFPALASADLSRLKRIISRWKPAKATCVGVVAVQTGKVWGYPASQVWGAATGNWGGSTTQLLGAF